MERFDSQPVDRVENTFHGLASPHTQPRETGTFEEEFVNYFRMQRLSRQMLRHGYISERMWGDVFHTAQLLGTMEHHWISRSSLINTASAASSAVTGDLENQLSSLEKSLDKLLASFHRVAYDSLDNVYNPSLSLASSRRTLRSSSNVLALSEVIGAMDRSFEVLTHTTRDVQRALPPDGDVVSACLEVSARLDTAEAQLSRLEAALSDVERASAESDSVMNRIADTYGDFSR